MEMLHALALRVQHQETGKAVSSVGVLSPDETFNRLVCKHCCNLCPVNHSSKHQDTMVGNSWELVALNPPGLRSPSHLANTYRKAIPKLQGMIRFCGDGGNYRNTSLNSHSLLWCLTKNGST